MTEENNKPQQPTPYNSEQYPPGYPAQSYGPPPHYPQDDEIDLRELFGIVWEGKWWIIAITFVFAVGSVIYSLSLPDIYKAEATLAPTEESQGQGLGGELGGLANLAGISVGSGRVDKVTMAMEIMKSRQFIRNFVEKHNILPEIMAVKEWHQSSDKLIFNEEVYNAETKEWVREVEPPKQPEPTSWEYVNAFKGSLLIEKNENTPGLIKLAITHQSPSVAHRWVEWLIQDINNHMRQRDIQEAQSSMDYLQKELSETNLSSMQQVFYQLIEKQIQTIMLANVRPEYVFQVLDPSVVPEQRDSPSRALICIVGTFLGGFLSLLAVFIRHLVRTNKKDVA
ncbi:Wzz/FepE/Etk N-terminal domain-containing protein [Idiomarina abyssalis]|uniref:Wzz/FepE/Etk N-terminal domain-containing protein n=1 Tax=Idiomarina abyssalis TaxID=86102 RepID=UPI003A8F7655